MSEKKKKYVALYEYDNLMEGNLDAIDEIIAALNKNRLVLKIVDVLLDFLPHEMRLSKDKQRAWLG